MKRFRSLIMLVAMLCAGTLFAEDVTRFRGHGSQGKYNETGLLKVWPEKGLTTLWIRRGIGEGWSSVIKVRDRLYLNGLDPEDSKKESVVCLSLTGQQLWRRRTGTVWTAAYSHPRATPTFVAGDTPDTGKLVVFCGGGEIFCLAALDGEILWQKNLAELYETQFAHWGIAESVVVKDGVVFVTVCGKKALAVALKLDDGSVVWESPSNEDNIAYVTPVLYGDQLIVMTAKYVTGLNIADGKPLWQADYQEIVGPVRRPGVNCVTPLLKGNRFFVTSGFAQGGVMFEILPGNKGVERRWTNKALDTYHGGVVELDGRIYGSDFKGNWVCLDWETGETVYNEPWEKLGKGAVNRVEFDTAGENLRCPTDAIVRTYIEDPYFEYTIDEDKCVGCGKCVKGCKSFGNGSLFLQVRHDLCKNCNQCRIASVCPSNAYTRVTADEPYLFKRPPEQKTS